MSKGFFPNIKKYIERNFLLGKKTKDVSFYVSPETLDVRFTWQAGILVYLEMYTALGSGVSEIDYWHILCHPDRTKRPKDYPAQVCSRTELQGPGITPNSTLQKSIVS